MVGNIERAFANAREIDFHQADFAFLRSILLFAVKSSSFARELVRGTHKLDHRDEPICRSYFTDFDKGLRDRLVAQVDEERFRDGDILGQRNRRPAAPVLDDPDVGIDAAPFAGFILDIHPLFDAREQSPGRFACI